MAGDSQKKWYARVTKRRHNHPWREERPQPSLECAFQRTLQEALAGLGKWGELWVAQGNMEIRIKRWWMPGELGFSEATGMWGRVSSPQSFLSMEATNRGHSPVFRDHLPWVAGRLPCSYQRYNLVLPQMTMWTSIAIFQRGTWIWKQSLTLGIAEYNFIWVNVSRKRCDKDKI